MKIECSRSGLKVGEICVDGEWESDSLEKGDSGTCSKSGGCNDVKSGECYGFAQVTGVYAVGEDVFVWIAPSIPGGVKGGGG